MTPARLALLLPIAVLLRAGEVADQTVKTQARLLPGAPAAELRTQVVGPWDKPVGQGFSVGGQTVAVKLDDKGRLSVDAEGKGSFRQVAAKGGTVPLKLTREVAGKPKTVTLTLLFTPAPGGAGWQWRNASAVGLALGGEELLAVDIDGDGAFNGAGTDGLLWHGQLYAFPFPAAGERFCTAKLDLTGLKMGPWGEDPAVQGRPLATTVPEALPVLQGTNEQRVLLGLTPRPEDVKLSADLQQHCAYMAGTGKLAHPEDKGTPGYTPEGHAAGMRSILSQGTAPDQIAARMVETFYHRQDVIRPETTGFGVGYASRFGGIDGRTAMHKEMKPAWPVLCPAPAQRDVPLRFAPEMPDPISGDRDAGFPVTAYFGTKKLKMTTGSIAPLGKDGKPSAALDCYPFDPEKSGNMVAYQKVVCLIPKDPLAGGTTYRVQMTVEVDGTVRELAWDFTTLK